MQEAAAVRAPSTNPPPAMSAAAMSAPQTMPAAIHTRTSRRGFAAMDKTRQKEIASAGGRAAHERGNAHEFTSEEARLAGRKGGQTVSQNRQHMANIGRKGGVARGQRQEGLARAND